MSVTNGRLFGSAAALGLLLACGCSGGGGGGGGSALEPETGLRPDPHLYRDVLDTLDAALAGQADSPDEGVVREFTVTGEFPILLPAPFFRGEDPFWQLDDAALDSTVYLWPGVQDGHVLRILGRAGFRGTYGFTDEDAVQGWGRSAAFVWPALYRGRHPSDVGIVHDIALAYTDALGASDRLRYSAYGWWALAPTASGGALDTSRLLSAFGGISLGLETFARDMPRQVNATWRGRATGHALDADGRWVLEGDAFLSADLQGPAGTFLGTIRNTRIVPLDPETLMPDAARAGDWHTVRLDASAVSGNTYSGRASVNDPITDPAEAPAGFAGPQFGAPTGRYTGAFNGPDAIETSGQWWLIESYADRTMGEMVVVGSFGARREPADRSADEALTLESTPRPDTLTENNYRASRLQSLRLLPGGIRTYQYEDNARSLESGALPGGFENPYAVTLQAPGDGIDYAARLGGRYGYQGTYTFTPSDRVEGFGAGRFEPITWQPVWHLVDVPSDPGHHHDVMISVTDRGPVGADLDHALYGWWAVTPYDGGPNHPYYFTLNAAGGIGVGLPTDPDELPEELSGTWSGRVTGHVGEQPDKRRYTLAGALQLQVSTQNTDVRFAGAITDASIIEVSRETLTVLPDAPSADWHDVDLQGEMLDGNAFHGTAVASGEPGAGPDFRGGDGFFFGRFYGPGAEELAGEWGIRAADSLGLVAGGFGAARESE